MDKLSDKILLRIFSQLPLNDRRKARMVCKQWRKITYAYPLIKKEITIIQNYRSLISFYNQTSKFSKIFKPANVSIVINKEDIQEVMYDKEKNLWRHFGRKLQSLQINIAMVHFRKLLDILVRCQPLKYLDITINSTEFNSLSLDISVFEQVFFQKLLSFSVKGTHNHVIPVLYVLIMKSPLLESITFICNRGSCINSCLYNQFEILPDFRHTSNLNTINVQCALIDNKFIDNLTESLNFQLKSLSIAYCWGLSDPSLRFLEQRCKSLKQLSLKNFQIFDTNCFKKTITALNKLTVVSFFSSNRIDDEMIASLSVLPSLAHLNISKCKKVTYFGIYLLLGIKKQPSLVELRLDHIQIKNSLIKLISQNLPNLKILHLSYCTGITAKCLESVSKNNPDLICLLLYCYKSANLDFDKCINKMRKLNHLCMIGWSNYSNEFSRNLRLPHLKVLDSSMFLFDAVDLLQRCPSLKYVNNYCCETMTEICNADIAVMKRNRVLECYKSPFGPCYFVRSENFD